MKKIILLLLVCSLAACAALPYISATGKESRIAFPEQEYQNLAVSGTATVKGELFLKVRGGDVKVVAENEVYLNPVTSYSSEWYQKAYVQGLSLVDPDPRLFNYLIKTASDANGRFVFNDVPPGRYYVSTVVEWPPPVGYRSDLQVLGGVATTQIIVEDDYVVMVSLTCILHHIPLEKVPVIF